MNSVIGEVLNKAKVSNTKLTGTKTKVAAAAVEEEEEEPALDDEEEDEMANRLKALKN